MSLNLYIKNNNLHHAYCILGGKENVTKELKSFFLKELNFSIENNPDFCYREFDIMNIEDGRSLKNLHQNKPIAGDKKIFMIIANFITEKAQNSLLKLFEEPRGDTHFFLIIPSLNNIIPTFRSRLFIIDIKKNESSVLDPQEFLGMSIKEKMNSIKKICESISNEEESKIEIINFINLLQMQIKMDINADKCDYLQTKNYKILEEIEKVRQYASEQSSSLKMLLEHISLML